jgi:hypothetical protein
MTPVKTHVLPASFRRIRLELAREPGHPEGSSEIGYDFVAPLDTQGRVDPELWRAHRNLCTAVRFRPNEQVDIGHLTRVPGGSWRFRYDIEGDEADEPGYRFGDHAFRAGEYVSVSEDGVLHTFRVVSVKAVN